MKFMGKTSKEHTIFLSNNIPHKPSFNPVIKSVINSPTPSLKLPSKQSPFSTLCPSPSLNRYIISTSSTRMRQDDKKYHQYSLSFYQRQKDLLAVTNRVKLGFSHFDRNQKSLKPRTVENFLKFNERNKANQKLLLQDDPEAYVETFVDIILNLNRDRDLMEYVLATLDAVLTEERSFLREAVDGLRKGRYNGFIAKLKSFLSVEDHREVTIVAAARVTSILLGELPLEQFGNDQRLFLLDLLQIKKAQRQILSEYAFVSCFAQLNKHADLAKIFLENGGGAVLVECLTRGGNDIQLIYYSLLNIWMLSFSEEAVEKFISIPRIGVVRAVCEILQKVSREKITRVAFMIFKNIEKDQGCLELMMDYKLLKIVDTILKGNIKDEELINSIKDIATVLQSNIRVLSSFDKYVKEVNADSLEWSSVHTERFWKENAIRFQANDYQLVKKLKYLLSSKRALNAAIACYDLGEFCRFYPRGKAVIETLQIKDLIMEKARFSDDKAVREQALLALQKIMIQNWQAI